MNSPPRADTAVQPWSVIGSRYLHCDRWLRVRADTCVSAEGALIDPYYVLEYPDWVAVVALNEANQVIMVQQYRHPVDKIVLGIPAGAVDVADADCQIAAQRELLEETGYVADRWEHITTLASNPAHMSNSCHVLLARGARLVGEPAREPAERLQVVLLPVGEVKQRALAGAIAHSGEVAALALALSRSGQW